MADLMDIDSQTSVDTTASGPLRSADVSTIDSQSTAPSSLVSGHHPDSSSQHLDVPDAQPETASLNPQIPDQKPETADHRLNSTSGAAETSSDAVPFTLWQPHEIRPHEPDVSGVIRSDGFTDQEDAAIAEHFVAQQRLSSSNLYRQTETNARGLPLAPNRSWPRKVGKRTFSGKIKASGPDSDHKIPVAAFTGSEIVSQLKDGKDASRLSDMLRARLNYAALKVRHGWEEKDLNEVERLTEQKRSSTSPDRPSASPSSMQPDSNAASQPPLTPYKPKYVTNDAAHKHLAQETPLWDPETKTFILVPPKPSLAPAFDIYANRRPARHVKAASEAPRLTVSLGPRDTAAVKHRHNSGPDIATPSTPGSARKSRPQDSLPTTPAPLRTAFVPAKSLPTTPRREHNAMEQDAIESLVSLASPQRQLHVHSQSQSYSHSHSVSSHPFQASPSRSGSLQDSNSQGIPLQGGSFQLPHGYRYERQGHANLAVPLFSPSGRELPVPPPLRMESTNSSMMTNGGSATPSPHRTPSRRGLRASYLQRPSKGGFGQSLSPHAGKGREERMGRLGSHGSETWEDGQYSSNSDIDRALAAISVDSGVDDDSDRLPAVAGVDVSKRARDTKPIKRESSASMLKSEVMHGDEVKRHEWVRASSSPLRKASHSTSNRNSHGFAQGSEPSAQPPSQALSPGRQMKRGKFGDEG